jgi:predicted membrane-bound mannosyltransferase
LAAVVLLAAIVVARVAATYSITSQGFDEPCHVAAALEFLDKGTYTLDPVHPPLARVAIGLPLYLLGVRYPPFPPDDAGARNYNVVGNRILFDGVHYARNLTAARIGVLPFLLAGVIVVFLWTRQLSGAVAAVFAVGLLTTLPVILAFSRLAYTDIAAGTMQTLKSKAADKSVRPTLFPFWESHFLVRFPKTLALRIRESFQ